MKILILLVILFVIYRIIKSQLKKTTPVQHNEITFEDKGSFNDNFDDDFERPNKPAGKPAVWFGIGQAAKIKNYTIPGGFVYVGTNLPDVSGYANDACLINPDLSVSSSEPWDAGEMMNYWPHYGDIPDKCRGAYLQWLATGRKEPEAYIGYVFLFFYGLERRLLVDDLKGNIGNNERTAIIKELTNLIKIYKGNRSFRGYANNLLAMVWILSSKGVAIPDYIDFNDRYCTEPFRVLIARTVAAGKPISPDLALKWLKLSPDYKLRTPARRCAKEFRNLFILRYKKKYGDGLIIKPNKTRLKIYYRAASPSLRTLNNINLDDLADPFRLKGPLNKFAAIAEDCTTELEGYSRYLGWKTSDPKSLNAFSLIPKELIEKSSGGKIIKGRLSKIVNGGIGLISLENLYKTLGQKPLSKILKKDLESLANFIETFGFGLAPDIRHHNMKPSLDGDVVVFAKGHGVDFKSSREYRTLGTILRLGAMVSQIDQDSAPAEEKLLKDLIVDNRELNNIEKDSLTAFLHWCLRTPQIAAGLKQRLSGVSKNEKTAISHILVSVAHADGEVKPEEVKQLEKLYTTLGLDKAQVTGDLHALAAEMGPVTVGLKEKDTGYAIPEPPKVAKAAKGYVLNEELINIRAEETKLVKSVLEEIFTEQDEEDKMATEETEAVDSENPLALLDKVHQNLFARLIKKETWDKEEFHKVCKELGLMADGAMEILNEWSYDNVSAPLIDDGEPVYVDVDLGREIINA